MAGVRITRVALEEDAGKSLHEGVRAHRTIDEAAAALR